MDNPISVSSTTGTCNGHPTTSSELLNESANGVLRSRIAANGAADKPVNLKANATLKPVALRRDSDGSNVSRFGLSKVAKMLWQALANLKVQRAKYSGTRRCPPFSEIDQTCPKRAQATIIPYCGLRKPSFPF